MRSLAPALDSTWAAPEFRLRSPRPRAGPETGVDKVRKPEPRVVTATPQDKSDGLFSKMKAGGLGCGKTNRVSSGILRGKPATDMTIDTEPERRLPHNRPGYSYRIGRNRNISPLCT
jgi:hypothetical protein